MAICFYWAASSARKLLSLFPGMEAPWDDSGRRPLELGRLTFVGGAGFDALAQYGAPVLDPG
ncbi:hypothetical protein XH98_14130 [Bradyrhizobium sp. CCBAU 51745]|nr:hypothetical protein [Bradyrhizobium sp. CCBAU 45384]MDA9440236.1 hypothetical protein [Bradyrhizobium sp. CCBAU 51745]